ncbi:MAG: glycosyltransferase family 2 protein [bacterium]|nr:glycosyltransferase family 2 protein [bacterium]
MRKFLEEHEAGFQRFLEIFPGFVSWNLILFPYWGILIIPTVVAYFVLLFDVYWFFQSLTVAFSVGVAHIRMQAAKVFDWLGEVKQFPDWKEVKHVIIIVTYKEPLHILQRTLQSLADQDLPLNQLYIVLAMETKEPEEMREPKVKALRKQFGKTFGDLLVTVHTLVPGEVIGKSSNERYAAIDTKRELVDKRGFDIKYMTVTSCDADHTYHPKHFSYLTYKFLDDPDRYNKFWQPAIFFYQNIWKLPTITRSINILSSVWNLSQLPRKDRLVNMANYSLSYDLADRVGYWDADIIPEDYHMFFKAFYKTGGKVEVEGIYLPLMADAPEAGSTWATAKSQYFQYQRWAWGVSDDAYAIKHYILTPGVPRAAKTMRLIGLLTEHILWPVNWFIITLGLSVPILLNPTFARTVLGYTLPGLSSIILTICLVFLVVMLVVDFKQRPARPADYPLWRALLLPLEFLLLPVVGLVFGALPGLDAHTRLMLGKYLEYKVTEKR